MFTKQTHYIHIVGHTARDAEPEVNDALKNGYQLINANYENGNYHYHMVLVEIDQEAKEEFLDDIRRTVSEAIDENIEDIANAVGQSIGETLEDFDLGSSDDDGPGFDAEEAASIFSDAAADALAKILPDALSKGITKSEEIRKEEEAKQATEAQKKAEKERKAAEKKAENAKRKAVVEEWESFFK